LVALEAERVLREKGELCISDLTYHVSKRTRYDLNAQQVAMFLSGHPRIRKRAMRAERSAYYLGNLDIHPPGA
tara:strand:+ start:1347 stop:1565 length:219 start_codon:yes stop_codon:yes gene_type:complete